MRFLLCVVLLLVIYDVNFPESCLAEAALGVVLVWDDTVLSLSPFKANKDILWDVLSEL